jgi:hypothetical protein
MDRFAERFDAWVESLSPTIRPMVAGAFIIVIFALMRGAWFIVPIAVIYVFATNAHPWSTIAFGAGVTLAAMAAGALSGLSYRVLGRHVQRAFRGGWYITGVVTVAPYMLMLNYINRIVDDEPVLVPLTGEDLLISGFLTLVVGLVIGHSWFGPEKSKRS